MKIFNPSAGVGVFTNQQRIEEKFKKFLRFGSKGSICSMSSKGWGFRKVEAAFPYFLFLVSYSLFTSVFAPLRALRGTKNFVPLSLCVKKIAFTRIRAKKSQSKNENESE